LLSLTHRDRPMTVKEIVAVAPVGQSILSETLR
jgi:hypothetical protein